jgi:hypothetical protein
MPTRRIVALCPRAGRLTAVLSTAMSYDIVEVVGSDYHVVARISKHVLGGVQR